MITVRKKQVFIWQFVFEARYGHGYEYLDRCGYIINSIQRDNHEWDVLPPGPEGTQLKNLSDGTGVVFSSQHLGLSLHKPLFGKGEPLAKQDLEIFSGHIQNLSDIVFSEIRIKPTDLTRVGARVFYYIPFESKDEAEQWMIDSKFFSFNKPELFEGILSSPSFALKWKSDPFSWGLRFDIYERNAQMDLGKDVNRKEEYW